MMTSTNDNKSYQKESPDNHQFSVELPFLLTRCEWASYTAEDEA
jgi:hypothetical protein